MASTTMFPFVNEKPFDDIRNLETRNQDQSYSVNTDRNANTRKPRKVIFYKNGDKYFGGKLVAITPNKYFSFRELMNDLNRSVDLPYGVRRVYTPVNGREIYDIDELEDGSSYVCASFEPFRPTKYGDNIEKPWNGKIVHPSHRQEINGSNVPQQALPSIHASYPNNSSQNSTNQNYYLPRHYIKHLPLVANNNGFVVSNSQSMKRSNHNIGNLNAGGALAPLTNKSNNNNPTNSNAVAVAAAAAAVTSEAWSKPRLITIVRATEKPRKKISILLNRKGLHSYEQFVCDISDAFGLPQWKNDKIRKLYTIRGKRVQGISDFFREDDMFVGCGKEALTPKLIQDLLDEVYQENPDYAQAIFNEWESTRSRAKPRYSSLEQNLNNSLGTGSMSTHRGDVNGADTSPEVVNRKSYYNVEFDENGKRKRKKKIAESDILLEMETQRQRERIKLIEIERKKREQANTQQSKANEVQTSTTPNNTNPSNTNNNNNNNNSKYANNKRVNIKTPTNRQIQDNDLLPPLDTKKLKRKPKFKKYLVDDTMETPSQKNPTPSSVSGVILEEHPPSRNLKSKSPAKDAELLHVNNNNHPDAKSSTSTLPALTTNHNHPSTNHLSVTPQPPVQLEAATAKQPQTPATKPENKENERPKKVINKKDEIITGKMKRQISNASHVAEKYDFIKTLGDGNFAVVKQARHKITDHEYAIKIIDKSKMKGKENMIENEIYIMKSCNHPNIVKLYEEFETKDEVYLVTDLVKGGDLFDAITQSVKFNEKDSACMVQDLCEALFYLHSKNIVHRDLKPENLLVMRRKDDKISIKLADFGLAMEVKHPIFTVCGTPTYVAPEILSEIGYGLEVDMWACGVITYILLCGFPPFRSLDRNQDELFQYIQAGEFEYLMPYWEGISESSKDLINHLLVVDIKKRWKAEDVLCHPWIVTQGNTKSMPSNHDEYKKEHLNELKVKAKAYAAEPFVTS